MPSVAYRAVNSLSKGIPKFVMKHPVLLAGGTGVALGASNMNRQAQALENRMRLEAAGYPEARYASDSLAKFAEHKKYLDVKTTFEKVSQWGESLQKGVGSGIGREGIALIRRLVGSTAQQLNEKLIADQERRKLLNSIIKEDPDVATAEAEDPGQAARAFETMRHVAPTLSRDPNVVVSFLRNAAMTGGAIDYNMIKGLAEAEGAVHRARSEGAWLGY